jgi:hypothetical protein
VENLVNAAARFLGAAAVALLGTLALGLLGTPALASDSIPLAAADSNYVNHPRLLFTAADIPALRAKVLDGGDDDATYSTMRLWAGAALASPVTSLLGTWEGLHSVGQLGLVAQVDTAGAPFAAKCREIVLYLARNRDVTSDEFGSSLRLQTMALGYDLAFADATPAECQEVRDEMRAYLDFMPGHFNYFSHQYNPYTGNHGLTVGASIGLAVIALWEDVPSAEQATLAARMTFGDALLQKCTTDILGADGAYKEGVLYAGWIYRMLAPYAEARLRFDGTDLVADPRFARTAEWLCYELLPEGGARTNNLNDSPWTTRPLALHNTYLPWAQARFGSLLARYLQAHVTGAFGYDYTIYADRVATVLWTQPLPLVNPATLLPDGKLFADRGLYAYRSGWKEAAAGDEILFTFYAGKFYGGHAQEDQNHFTLAAYGERLVVDCGAVGASSTPKQTQAHNAILVDGLGQHNAGNSIGTDGVVAASLLTPFADFVHGDAGSAYATYSPFNAAGVPFPTSDWSWGYDGGNPLLRADRRVLVVKGIDAPPWILLADDVVKDGGTHLYEWLLHLRSNLVIDASARPIVAQGGSANLDVYFAHPEPAALSVGWDAYLHGGSDPATTRLVAAVTAAAPRFFTALVPRGAGMASPGYASWMFASGAAGLALDWGVVRDVAVHDPERVWTWGALAAGGDSIGTDGAVALVRHGGEEVLAFTLAQGTRLQWNGLDLAQLDSEAAVTMTSEVVYLDRDGLGFRVWAPRATRVVGPAGDLPFVHNGDFVVNPAASDVAAQRERERVRFEPVTPNPVRGSARFAFDLTAGGVAHLRIVDVRGAEVATLFASAAPAGRTRVVWDGRDARGRRPAAGVYLAVLDAGGQRRVRRFLLAR